MGGKRRKGKKLKGGGNCGGSKRGRPGNTPKKIN